MGRLGLSGVLTSNKGHLFALLLPNLCKLAFKKGRVSGRQELAPDTRAVGSWEDGGL